MAHIVFICHSSKDKQVADAVCAALEAQRIPCWIAPRDILAGEEYGKSIIDALTSCQIVLLIFSAHANDSAQVRREIERAVSKGKIIVPFRIEDVLPSDAMEFALSNTHWLDALTPPLERYILELCDTIARLIQRHKESEPLIWRPLEPVQETGVKPEQILEQARQILATVTQETIARTKSATIKSKEILLRKPKWIRALAEKGEALTREQAAGVLEEILAGSVPEVETAALLTAMATRGEQAPELVGFVEVMRRYATPLPFTPSERDELVDAVGTGGGGPRTFNISCGAALVAAAAGAKVAKHGNRAVTSVCGAADVLEALGVPIELGPELAVECLRQTGFVFLFAPLYHPAMKALGPLRRALGISTIFNLCGPLTNPAGARTQVIGVLSPSRVLLVGHALVELGAKRAFVVHGTDGIDELTTTGESIVARIEESETGGESTLHAARITPEMAGLPRATLDQFTGGDIATNKALLYDVLTGIPGARRDIVLLNAAATLVAAGLATDLKEGVRQGAEAIDSGQAAALLAKLRDFGTKHASNQ